MIPRGKDPISRVLSDAGLRVPDGRPFYQYHVSEESFSELERLLRERLVWHNIHQRMSAAFVLWAAEHIRSRYPGGGLTWDFVLEAINLTSADQDLGRELTETGLSWWGREVRVSKGGARLFLYSLLSERGIPEALLREPGLYRDVVMGLIAEIELEGGPEVEPWSEDVASRWLSRLPQTFQNADMARLLAELASKICALRERMPGDQQGMPAVVWLNENIPDWKSGLPLRMTPEVARNLIRPALQAVRRNRGAVPGPLCHRELRRHPSGVWHGYLTLEENAYLPVEHFRGARDLRLRLIPADTKALGGLSYVAVPDGKGWQLRLLKKNRQQDFSVVR